VAKINIIESNADIQKKINKALAKEVNKSLAFTARLVKSRIEPIIKTALLSSPEITSLRGGVLKAEFGLTSDPTGAIVNAIVSSLDVQFTKVDQNFNGGLAIVMQPDNFANLFSLSVAEQPLDDYGSLPWLQWLLTLGDAIIITDFGVEFGNLPNSRTGLAVMRKSKAPYKVNSAFSGTTENNFITRSVGRVRSQIVKIIEGVMKNGR